MSFCNANGASLLISLGIKPIKCNSHQIGVADGFLHSIKQCFNVAVDFNNSVKLISFYLFPSLTDEFLLGMDFWKNFKLEIKIPNELFCSSISQDPKTTEGLIELSDINDSQKRELGSIIDDFRAISTGKLGRCTIYEHYIDTGDAEPIWQRGYPVSPAIEGRMGAELFRMRDNDVIEESNSPWSSPVVLVKKKNGRDRLCVDSRRVNKVTKKSRYALPRVDSILSRLGKAKYLSSIDLQDAFWQIPLEKSSREKTAFNVPGHGMWQFKRVPFGLNTSAQAMQRVMDLIFQDDDELIYIDDLIIASETFSAHIRSLRRVLGKLKAAGLTINFDKCQFCRSSLKYLGYLVDKHGLRTDPEKVECIANYPVPKTIKEVRRFVGMASWYRRFVRNFAELAAPLHNLTKKTQARKLVWNEEANNAFQSLKSQLIQSPVLASPDFSKKFYIQADASNKSIGSVLIQKDEDGFDRPIAYASRNLRGAELNYCVTEKECLAVVFAVEKFRQYVEGYEFEVVTDHSALLWLFKQQNLTGRLARWVMKLQQFDFELKHVKGKHNIVPDAISRIPQVSLINFQVQPTDTWYTDLMSKITSSPKRYKNYKILNGKIFVQLASKPCPDFDSWKLVVPPSARHEVLKENHDNPLAAHFGTYKTTKRILQRYYWPGVSKDVARYVKSCHVCLQSKPSTKQQLGLMGTMKKASRPWEVVSLDLIGPLVTSSLGNNYLLVVYDFFTKYPILIPLRTAKGKKISEVVEKQVFLAQGIPNTIIADNGKQFAQGEFKKLLETYGITNFFLNCPYHPQNNPVERTNKVVGSAMRCYIDDNHKHWDRHIDKIAVALRTATNVVTGFTPFYLNHGREFIFSGSDYQLIDLNQADPLLHRTAVFEQLASITDDIIRRMTKAYQRNKKYYDKKKVKLSFNIGDTVYRRNFVLSNAAKNISAKLAPKYLRCEVVDKVSDLVYLLKDDSGTIGRYHIKDIKNS